MKELVICNLLIAKWKKTSSDKNENYLTTYLTIFYHMNNKALVIEVFLQKIFTYL